MADTGASPTRAGFELPDDTPSHDASLSGLAAFGLGTLAAIGWLAALLLDLQTTRLPGWAREAPHAALVLAVPALVILVAQARGNRQAGTRWRVTLLALLVMAAASLPGLLLVSHTQDLASLPLRIPTLGLGVALGYVAPLRARSASQSLEGLASRGWSAVALAGAGFALLLAPVAFVLVATANANATTSACPPPPAQIDCGTHIGVGIVLEIAICGAALLALLLALAAGVLGGVIGRALGGIGR